MGIVARLAQIARTTFGNPHGTPGPTMYHEVSGLGDTLSAESFQHHGFRSRAPKGARVVMLPLGDGSRYMVTVAEHDYALNIEIADGETIFFSTTADGKTLKARIHFGADGSLKIANETRSLKAILATLVEHVRDLTTINCVQGSPVTLSPTTILNLNNDLAALGELLKE